MESLDANRDGLLQESELPERMRDRFREMGERAGVKPGEPIPLSALKSFGGRRRDDDDRRDRDEPRPDTPPAGSQPVAATPMPMPMSAEGATAAATSIVAPETKPEKVEPLVPGFGVVNDLPPIPGFDGVSKSTSAQSGTAASAGANASRGGASPESNERVQRYALSLMRQYDKNNNNILDPDEWKEMRGDPAQADTNKDGIITLQELTERLATYGKRKDSGSTGGGGGEDRPSSGEGSGKEARSGFTSSRSAVKPLPEGLPSWFAIRDKNADGMVSMAEYATSWTESLAAEFLRYDRNNDGFITTREALASTQSTTGTTSSAKSSESSSSSYGRDGERRRFGSRD